MYDGSSPSECDRTSVFCWFSSARNASNFGTIKSGCIHYPLRTLNQQDTDSLFSLPLHVGPVVASFLWVAISGFEVRSLPGFMLTEGRHHTVGTVPPSMTYSVPVMELASGETRNATRSATSLGFAGRPIGMPPSEPITTWRHPHNRCRSASQSPLQRRLLPPSPPIPVKP